MPTCSACRVDCTDEMMWPGDDGDICQNCWEAYCDRGWWRMVTGEKRLAAEGE